MRKLKLLFFLFAIHFNLNSYFSFNSASAELNFLENEKTFFNDDNERFSSSNSLVNSSVDFCKLFAKYIVCLNQLDLESLSPKSSTSDDSSYISSASDLYIADLTLISLF